MNVFTKIWEGLKLKARTTAPASSELGDIEVDSGTGKISYHNGSSSSPVVTESHTATLTGKTMDGGSNTFTNIPGSAISGPIDATDIADGSVNNTEFQYLGNVTSDIQTQINTKLGTTLANGNIFIGNGSNVATANPVTGDVVISNTGVTDISAGVIVNADINAAAAIDATKIANGSVDNTEFQYLDGVTSAIQTQLNAKASSASLTAHTGASSGVHGVTGSVVGTSDAQVLTNKTIDGDDNTVQDLALSSLKTIPGDAGKFVARDGSGVVVSTNTVPTGTVVGTSDTQTLSNKTMGDSLQFPQIATPSTPSSGFNRIYPKSTGKFYNLGSDGIERALGSGTGTLNFMNLSTTWSPDNTDNVDAEASVGSWVTFADAASSTPVDLTGGTATNLTLSRTTTAGEILDGTASFKVVKTANNSQGQGISCTFNVPPGYQGKLCNIKIPYKVTSGTVATGDITVWIYDVTNSVLITPLAQNIDQVSGTVNAYFTTSPSAGTPANQQYRVGIYFGSTSAVAQTIVFDDVSVAPVDSVYGPNISAWQAYTPTYGAGFGTVTNNAAFWRQVGDSIEIMGFGTTGTVAANVGSISLPNNYTVNSSKIGVANTTSNPGQKIGWYSQQSAETSGPVLTATGTSTSLIYFGNNNTTTTMLTPSTSISTLALTSNNAFSWGATVPVNELSASTPVTIINPNIGPWQVYTPTFTGFGTVSTQTVRWRQVGETIQVEGSFTAGTPTATEARISLPNSYVSSAGYVTLERCGDGSRDTSADNNPVVLIEPSKAYVVFGLGSAGIQLAKQNGNALLAAGARYAFQFAIRVDNLSAAGVINNPRSEIVLDTGNGSGSTNTGVRRFTNTRKSTGSAITYADSATNGASFTINEDGLYTINYWDNNTASDILIGITVNSSNLTGAVNTITYAQGRRSFDYVTGGKIVHTTFTGELKRGDIVRAQHQSANNASDAVVFTICKVSN